MRLWLDFETRSDVDIRVVQADVYVRHPSTRALMLAWAINDDRVAMVEGEVLPILVHHLANPAIQKIAWNAPFEIGVLLHRFGIDTSYGQWLDPMIVARYLTLPGSLGGCAAALGLAVQKEAEGKTLIRKFSQPSNSTAKMVKAGSPLTYWKNDTSDPEDGAAFIAYCRADVSVMREALRRMETYPAIPPAEWNLWRLDQKINLTGMPVDSSYVTNASIIMQRADAITLRDLEVMTGLRNPNSGPQMKAWLIEQNYPMESLDAEHVDAALITTPPTLVHSALSLRQKLSGAGPKKLAAITAQVSDDGRLRNQFSYYVGHTGRWAGRGVQVQNLPRPDSTVADRIDEITDAVRLGTLPNYLDVSTAITSTIRSSFRAGEGNPLVISDYSSIENRVLAWLADCTPMVAVYREGRDAYKAFAVMLYNVLYEDVTKQQRTSAKPAVLGCGYGMSAKRLAGYAKSMGISMTEEEAQSHVDAFRSSYPEIPTLWATIQRNAFAAVCDRKKYAIGNGLVFDGRDQRFLRIGLHSGRDLFYLNPTISTRVTYFGEMQSMSYESAGKAGLQVTHTYGAKLVENIVQALNRDILCQGLLGAWRAGYHIIGHVHDEIISEEPIDSDRNAATLEAIMSRSPGWAPFDAARRES